MSEQPNAAPGTATGPTSTETNSPSGPPIGPTQTLEDRLFANLFRTKWPVVFEPEISREGTPTASPRLPDVTQPVPPDPDLNLSPYSSDPKHRKKIEAELKRHGIEMHDNSATMAELKRPRTHLLPVEHDPFTEKPPFHGAMKAPDGKWYSPDPRPGRKGKWLRDDG